jgi:hypothetical protein
MCERSERRNVATFYGIYTEKAICVPALKIKRPRHNTQHNKIGLKKFGQSCHYQVNGGKTAVACFRKHSKYEFSSSGGNERTKQYHGTTCHSGKKHAPLAKHAHRALLNSPVGHSVYSPRNTVIFTDRYAPVSCQLNPHVVTCDEHLDFQIYSARELNKRIMSDRFTSRIIMLEIY